MPFDSDVALVGTGLAPLVAAHRLIREGKSVLLLNPDRDFFLEDSELPLDPTGPAEFDRARFEHGMLDEIIETLSPEYPGALEKWSSDEEAPPGFRDPRAPHVRGRSRIWAFGLKALSGDSLERFYVGASDAGLRPQLHEGIAALRRFPGASSRGVGDPSLQAVQLSRRWDADVERYRSGVLEFLRERLEADRILCDVSQIESTPDGLRFYAAKHSHSVRVREAILVYWTPRLDSWARQQCRKFERGDVPEMGMRLWEDWTLTSRDPLDPGTIGVYQNQIVWADIEGAPLKPATSHRLRVLRPAAGAPSRDPEQAMDRDLSASESLGSLTSLCQDFLKWDKFAIRSMKPRLLLDWKPHASNGRAPAYILRKESPLFKLVTGADGSLAEVVATAARSCESVP